MENISTRIKKCVDESGLKMTGFAKKLNVSIQFVSQLCAGVRNPSDRTIADICREFNINETWLRTGEGNMYNEALVDELDGILDKYGLPRELRGLFTGYLKLSDSAKQEVCNLILHWASDVTTQSAVIPTMSIVPIKHPQEMTDEELHAALDRQLAEEKNQGENPEAYGDGKSATGIA